MDSWPKDGNLGELQSLRRWYRVLVDLGLDTVRRMGCQADILIGTSHDSRAKQAPLTLVSFESPDFLHPESALRIVLRQTVRE